MAQRIKGQEVEVLLVVDGSPKTTITAIKSFELTFQQEIQSEGFLGETADRKDEVFKGVRGQMEVQHESPDVLRLFTQVVDRARRRTPGVRINVKATLNFPSGRRARIMIPDCAFGELPLNFGGRTEYGSSSISFEASEARVLF